MIWSLIKLIIRVYVNPELGLCIGALTLKARLLVDVPSNMQDTQVYPSMFSRVTNTCPCDAIVSFTLTILWDIELLHYVIERTIHVSASAFCLDVYVASGWKHLNKGNRFVFVSSDWECIRFCIFWFPAFWYCSDSRVMIGRSGKISNPNMYVVSAFDCLDTIT